MKLLAMQLISFPILTLNNLQSSISTPRLFGVLHNCNTNEESGIQVKLPCNFGPFAPPTCLQHHKYRALTAKFERKSCARAGEMANLRHPRYVFLCAFFQFLLLVQTTVLCFQYKVGNLDAWGTPPSANPLVYTNWSKNHIFKIGDSLLFLYPPSQDSVIQVTEQSFNACNLTDPILYMNNGNSLFNITSEGQFYFTSGVAGHCEMKQKLHIFVGNVSAYSPSYGPSALPEISPSYPTVFGTIPAAPSSSPSQSSTVFLAALVGFAIYALISGSM